MQDQSGLVARSFENLCWFYQDELEKIKQGILPRNVLDNSQASMCQSARG